MRSRRKRGCQATYRALLLVLVDGNSPSGFLLSFLFSFVFRAFLSENTRGFRLIEEEPLGFYPLFLRTKPRP